MPSAAAVAVAKDDLDERLLRACALIESEVSRRRSQEDAGSAEIRLDSRASVAAADEIIGRARRELVAVVSSTNASAVIQPIMDALPVLARQGVRVRLLITPSATPGREGWLAELAAQPVTLRFARSPIQDLVIADTSSALVYGPAHTQQTTLSHNSTIVNSLYTLFDGVWEQASGSPIRSRQAEATGIDGEVLVRLRNGCTDEVAARELEISARTYRRYVAKIMQDIGATSRFQAGVLASQRGLLNSGSSSRSARCGRTAG